MARNEISYDSKKGLELPSASTSERHQQIQVEPAWTWEISQVTMLVILRSESLTTDKQAGRKLYDSISSSLFVKYRESFSGLRDIYVPKRESIDITIPTPVMLIAEVEDYPRGFPKLACFLNSDDSFMVYRRFGLLFSRLLLNKQDEIREMEVTLLALDRTDDREGNTEYIMSRTLDLDRDKDSIPPTRTETRAKLLEKLEKKILEYSELLLKARELKALEKPSARDYQSVLHFMENDGGQLFEEKSGWIYDREDLVTIRPSREYAWLEESLELMLKVFRCKPLEETRSKTDDEAIHYYDRTRIATSVTMIITGAVLITLMLPVWLLYKASFNGIISKTPETMILVFALTMIFSAAVSAFTKALRYEVVVAFVGYCAVLVVVLGSVN